MIRPLFKTQSLKYWEVFCNRSTTIQPMAATIKLSKVQRINIQFLPMGKLWNTIFFWLSIANNTATCTYQQRLRIIERKQCCKHTLIHIMLFLNISKKIVHMWTVWKLPWLRKHFQGKHSTQWFKYKRKNNFPSDIEPKNSPFLRAP